MSLLLIGACKKNSDVTEQQQGRALGNRVAIVYSEGYQIKLAGLERFHPFDINKYAKIRKHLVRDAGVRPEDVFIPEPISPAQILAVHSRDFMDSLEEAENVASYLEAPVLGYLPDAVIDKQVLDPLRLATGGTLLASRLALSHGIGINLGGGFHHAMPEHGEGFSIYADIAIAIRVLQEERKISHALVIDLDVHQGNGTALCLADDESTYTFSMHQGDIYPVPKERSDRDVELEAGTDDEAYLAILRKELDMLFEKSRPDLVVYQAGCDTLEGDPLASLEMSEEGVLIRDLMVIDECRNREVPVVMTLGGGYSKDAWHAQYLSIKEIIRKYGRDKQK